MSKRYIFAALATGMAMIATPAVADGYADRPVQKGPPPLEAHAPAPDCELIGDEDWYCPPAHSETRRYVDESKTRHYVKRYTTGGICCAQTAPPQRVAYRPTVERGLSIDIDGFTGGVGAGVDGGFYGGGGGFAYASASASSSAYASAAARIAFSASFRGGHKGKGGGCKGGCGKGGH